MNLAVGFLAALGVIVLPFAVFFAFVWGTDRFTAWKWNRYKRQHRRNVQATSTGAYSSGNFQFSPFLQKPGVPFDWVADHRTLPHARSTEPIVAHRLWRVRPCGRYAFLESVAQHTVWPAGEALRAHHITADQPLSHNGVHAFKEPQTEEKYREHYAVASYHRGDLVFGSVALWGKVIEHEAGYRAQYAYPQSLIVPAKLPNALAIAQALKNTYGCETRVE